MRKTSFVPEPMERTTIHLRRDQRRMLARISAESGLTVAQLVRDALDEKYPGNVVTVGGWEIRAIVKKPIDTNGAPPPPRARLREWFGDLRRDG